MGKSAFYLLLNLISKQPINHIILEPELVKRESTAKAALNIFVSSTKTAVRRKRKSSHSL